MTQILYAIVFLSSLDLFLCDKKAPPDINSIINAKHRKDEKSVEFLHKIKEDLRRNNDDYADAMARVATKIRPPKEILKFHYVKGNNKIIDGKRRAYESFSDEDTNATDYKETETPGTDTPKRFSKVQMTATPTETTKISKENLDRLKMFFKKKEALESGRGKFQVTTMRNEEFIRMKAKDSGEQIPLPNSEQLDMAPAKGGRVHMLRLKGRMCQRNVLIPEGPKYDSKGQVYLAAFKPGPNNLKFENTLPPKIILPRCCNCCHKSVLGCE